MNEKEKAIELLKGLGYEVMTPKGKRYVIKVTTKTGVMYNMRKDPHKKQRHRAHEPIEYAEIDLEELTWIKYKEDQA